MRQILFVIPLHQWLGEYLSFLPDIPIYGYGLMLFFAYIFCTQLAKRLCKREGIDGSMIPDLAIWLFISGIIGGRTVYVIQYWHTFPSENLVWRIIALWDGGLVLYGALIGGAVGYYAFYRRVLSKRNVSNWKMIDIIAPCIAVGVALGRVGCLFTGCCYGNVACESFPAIHFPLGSYPSSEMIKRGYQTPLGFLLKSDSFEVEAVEPSTPAADAGLRPGDHILQVNGKPAVHPNDVYPNAAGQMELTVLRGGDEVKLPPFEPRSIGLNPTQPYETISMCLLLFFLLSYYPFKRHDGELMVLLMFFYSIHRFLNEMLRTDTDPVAFGLTLSQNVSIGVMIAAIVLGVVVWRRPLIRKGADESAVAGASG